MEHLATWRSLYSLRYCPVTLVQTVFSAGTVYLLTAMQATSGIRIAWKEMNHAKTQLDRIMDYLQDIGASWQCSTNIAGILKDLIQDQPRLFLNEKTIDIDNSLRVPSAEDEDEQASQGFRDRMPSRKDRSRGRALSNSRLRQKERRGSHSRGPPTKQIVFVGQGSENMNTAVTLPSSIQSQTHLSVNEPVNISIQIPSDPPSTSGSPSSLSFLDARPGASRYSNSQTSISCSPSQSDMSDFRDSSPSTSFSQSPLSGRFLYGNPGQYLSHNWDALNAFEQESYPAASPFATHPSFSTSFNPVGLYGPSIQSYLSTEIAGFTGMLGGQTLSPFPSFGIPINADGAFLLSPAGSHSNRSYLPEGNFVPEHFQMSMDDLDQFPPAD